jgi:hypothetical protein
MENKGLHITNTLPFQKKTSNETLGQRNKSKR